MNDYIDRQAAIDAIHEWGLIDGLSEGQAIEILSDEEKVPSVQPEGWLARHRDEILKAGMEGREFEFRIGGRLFAIREKAQ